MSAVCPKWDTKDGLGNELLPLRFTGEQDNLINLATLSHKKYDMTHDCTHLRRQNQRRNQVVKPAIFQPFPGSNDLQQASDARLWP